MSRLAGIGTLRQIEHDFKIVSKVPSFLHKCWQVALWGLTLSLGFYGGVVIVGIWISLIIVPLLFVFALIFKFMGFSEKRGIFFTRFKLDLGGKKS